MTVMVSEVTVMVSQVTVMVYSVYLPILQTYLILLASLNSEPTWRSRQITCQRIIMKECVNSVWNRQEAWDGEWPVNSVWTVCVNSVWTVCGQCVNGVWAVCERTENEMADAKTCEQCEEQCTWTKTRSMERKQTDSLSTVCVDTIISEQCVMIWRVCEQCVNNSVWTGVWTGMWTVCEQTNRTAEK
jgi:hypothetical protein